MMHEPVPTPLTVIGAGPAGIMAAYTAAEAGVDVTLIDDNPLPGGQYYHQSPPEFSFSDPADARSGRKDAPAVLGRLPHPRIRTLYGTRVWGVFEGRSLALTDDVQSRLLPTDRIILATGAYDRPFAFPGWTLPGVIGAGAALRMIKTQWVLPGRRILLAGTGPLQLALAAALVKAGAEVVGIAEAANPYRHVRRMPNFWGHWDRLIEAADYLYTLRRHRTPIWYNHAITAASGSERVDRAVIARVDDQGRPLPGSEQEIRVDAVCLGYGLLPAFQLAAALGCRLRFDPNSGWFAPAHDQRLETSVPGIFVAGDVTDIAGSKVALLEGEIAGLNAAIQLEKIRPQDAADRLAQLHQKLKHLDRLAHTLQEIYAFRPGLAQIATDDTPLCRCEEVTLGQVKEAVAAGATDLHQVKLATRAGMGYCQGRFCSVLIAPVIAAAVGGDLSDLQPFTVRPPLQPVAMSVLAAGVRDL